MFCSNSGRDSVYIFAQLTRHTDTHTHTHTATSKMEKCHSSVKAVRVTEMILVTAAVVAMASVVYNII